MTHPGIKHLEKLLEEAKCNSVPIHRFFDELWLNGGTLPRPEMRDVTERVCDHVRSRKPGIPKDIAFSQLARGFIAFHEGNYQMSLLELAEAHKLFSELHDEDGVQAVAVISGTDYRTLGELELALKCLLEAYRHLSISSTFKPFLLFCTYNLAEIYSETGQFQEALHFHRENIRFCEETGNKNLLARSLNGIGVVYQHQKNYALALDYMLQSLELTEKLKNMPVKARSLTDLGVYYFEMGDYLKSRDFQNQALKIRMELKIPNGAVTNLIYLAEISLKLHEPDRAVELLNNALRIAEEIKVKVKAYQIHEMLSDICQSKGDLLSSLFHYKEYHRIRDEVQHEDNNKKIKNLQLIFEAEQTKKENVIIREQKKIIEEKNKDITDSINYALRIQEAFLPDKTEIFSSFPQSFILSRPKAIVSGDFYFFHKKGRSLFIAACDCTGHGVPGALMSMIGSEQLNDAVMKCAETSGILGLLNVGIKGSLRQTDSAESTRDGMDIALCMVDAETSMLKYAGANRPLWIIRKNQNIVEEIRATKKAIGGFTDQTQHFESHEIQLEPGDSFYIFTDGFADTFGGKEQRKLSTKRFREILLTIREMPMKEQELYLNNFIETWRGGMEQIDDILVIGVRV